MNYVTKSNDIPVLISDGVEHVRDLDKANCLNNHFVTSYLTGNRFVQDAEFDTSSLTCSDSTPFSFIRVSETSVHSAICQLDSSKASGPDLIPVVLLKACCDSLCYPLSMIFRKSLDTGIFPTKWKHASVTPIYKKKGDRHSVQNYRPISLLSNISKVFERIVYDQLYSFLSQNNLLNPNNSGFKKGDGAVNQLLYITHKIYEGFDKGYNTIIVFLDIKAAFDSVWHQGLIYKLQNLGICNSLLSWFTDYVSNRTQKVVLHGATSDTKPIAAGVPQGSILGPLLFLIYVNDFGRQLENESYLFADDSSVLRQYRVGTETIAENSINEDLIKLLKWATTWKLTFNISKTVLINFSLNIRNNPSLSISFDGTLIKPVETHKHLGIVLSSDLKWRDHVNHVVSSANKKLGLLKRRSFTLTRNQKSIIYINIIRPSIEYGSVIFSNCTIHDCLRLDNLQRRAAIICAGAWKHTETKRLMDELRWDSLAVRRNIADLTFFFKLTHNKLPLYLSKCISYSHLRTQQTRQSSLNSLNIFPPRCRTSCFQKSFFPSTSKLWNELPDRIKTSESFLIFKTSLKQHLNLPILSKNMASYYDLHKGKLGAILTQIRLGLSPLRGQMFIYNLTDNPICPNCFDHVETAEHYFLCCVSYTKHQLDLKNKVMLLLHELNVQTKISIDIKKTATTSAY